MLNMPEAGNYKFPCEDIGMSQTENIHNIRPINEQDAAFLNSLMNCPSVLQALNEVPSKLQEWTDAIKAWQSDVDEEDYIVLYGNTPIGWLGINGLLNEDKTVYLKMTALLPNYQNRGFGTAAIQKLMFMLRQKGFHRILLYTDQDNYAAQACYRKCGFKIIDSLTETMSNGKIIPRYIMEVSL